MTPIETIDEPLALIAEEFSQRCRRGETLTVEHYALKHPEYADRIRSLFPTLLSLEQASLTADGMERIGEFRILGEIGRGGMGVVYEAVQESLNRHVALKILPPELVTNEGAVERFHREARAAAQLHHGNIVPVFGVGEARWYALGTTVHYYAMQFIDGVGLDQLLQDVRRKREGTTAQAGLLTTAITSEEPLTSESGTVSFRANSLKNTFELTKQSSQSYFQTIVRWGIQAAEALAHAHDRGLVHRDVKPSNFLIDERAHLWLTDFGLAKAATDVEMTRTGDVIGTLRYLAPERLRGRASPQSDQFALAATLYECLTLQAVYPAMDKAHLLEQIHCCQIIPLRQHDTTLPVDLELILSTALEQNSTDRYGNMLLLADDLRRFQNGEPIHARRANRRYRAMKFISRHRKLVTATIAIVSLLLLGIVGTALGLVEANRSRQTAEQAQSQTLAAQLQTMKALQSATSIGVEKLISSKSVLSTQEKAYLESTLSLWKTFADEAGDAEQSRRMRAQGELEIGKLRVHLGQDNEAEAGFLRAIAIFQELVHLVPNQAEYQNGLSNSYMQLSLLCHKNSRYQEGLKRCEQALSIGQVLVSEHSQDREIRWKLANMLHTKGIILIDLQQDHEAQAQLEQSLQFLDSESIESLNDPDHLRLLGGVYFSIAQLYAKKGQYATAIKENSLALRWKQALVDRFPDMIIYRSSLCSAHNAMGVYHKNIGQLNEALNEYDAAINEARRLMNEYPLVPEYRYDLLQSTFNKAFAFQLQKKYDEALNLLKEGLILNEYLTKNYPEVVNYRRQLGNTHNNIGLLLKEQRKLPEAIQAYMDALDIQAALCGTFPHVLQYQSDLASSHNNLGIVYKDLGKSEEAREQYRKSMAIHEHLAKNNTDVLDYQINLGGSQVNYANLLNASGATSDSLTWWAAGINTLQPLVVQNPTVTKTRLFLMKAYRNRAKALMKLDRFPEAWLDWDQVVKLVDERDKLENRAEQAACVLHLNDVAMMQKALEIRLSQEPDLWTTYYLQLTIGHQQCTTKQYEIAERNLIAGYSGFKQRMTNISLEHKNQLFQALDDLIVACQAQGKPTDAWKIEKATLEANRSK